LQVVSVLLDSTDRRMVCLRGSHGGQGGSGVIGGEESGGGPNSPTAALDEIPARVWTKVGAAHSGKVLGTRRSCCTALGWLWRGGAARPRRHRGALHGGARRRGGRGAVVAMAWRGGCAGATGVRATNRRPARIAGVTSATRRKRIVEWLGVIPGSGRSF
jgi:hypothetical protein